MHFFVLLCSITDLLDEISLAHFHRRIGYFHHVLKLRTIQRSNVALIVRELFCPELEGGRLHLFLCNMVWQLLQNNFVCGY